MTKPAERTINYIVYPPNYSPGDGYRKAKNMRDAESICRKKGFGPGAEVVRQMRTRNRNGYQSFFTPFRNLGKNGRRFDEFIYNPKT